MDWKFGFVGSGRQQPARSTCRRRLPGDAERSTGRWPTTKGTIATFTDRSARRTRSARRSCSRWSTSTAADDCPIELTDVDADDVRIGGRVEMTFRKLFTADGIHNYFWKARPIGGERTDERDDGLTWHHTASRTASRSSGMGCTRFTEHWDKGLDDLLIDAADDGVPIRWHRPRTTSTPTGSAPRSRR